MRKYISTLIFAIAMLGWSSQCGGQIAHAVPIEKPPKKSTKKKAELAPVGPFKKKGAFEQIRDEIDQLVDIDLSNGALSAKMKSSYQEISPVIDSIRSKLGYGGGGNSSSGGTNFRFEFSTQKVNGVVKSSTEKKQRHVSLRMNEVKDEQRTLKLSSSDQGEFSLSIHGGKLPYLLRLRQSTNGNIVVQEIDGGKVFSCAAPNFDMLMQINSKFVNEKLLPLFERFGFGNMITPYSTSVQQQVLARLLKLTDADREKFIKLGAELDAKEFAKRKLASKNLRSKFAENSGLLMKVMNDPTFSPETRYRIQQIAQENEKSNLLATIKYVNRAGLAANTDYLFWLLQRQSDQPSFDRVLATIYERLGDAPHLDKPTTQSLIAGQTVAFFGLANFNRQTEEVMVDLFEEKGSIDKCRDDLNNFIRITSNNGNLALDREHWKKLFGGKSIRQLSDEVDALRKKNHLPQSWYRAGGNSTLSSANYPQVHFELISEKMGTNRNQTVYRYSSQGQTSSRNREHRTSKIHMKLTESKSRSKSNKDPLFQFTIEEQNWPFRRLVITETKTGQANLRFVSEASNVIVQIITDDAGIVYVHDLRGGQTFAAQAKSFEELSKKHPQYFSEKFFPLMQHIGLSIDPELMGKSSSAEKKSFWERKIKSD